MGRRILAIAALATAVVVLVPGGPASATDTQVGSETNLPLPRYVSLKKEKGNARRGPSKSHRIDWIFQHQGLPLQVTAEYGHWRRVQDRDGQGGWMHYVLLSGVRTVLVEKDLAALYSRPDPAAPMVAQLERGAIARLGACQPDWCQLSVAGFRGWTRKDAIWGVERDELRD